MAIIDKPSDYFNTKLYVGNESTNAITGVGHQPDFVWMKNRASAYYHGLYDSVRGTGNTKSLYSNANETEGQNSGNMNLASFNSDGFTLGATSSTNIINKSSQNHVSWNWKAGTSFTNDASATGIGTVDSTGSFNNDAGFSIVSYTNTNQSANSGVATIKHGLNTTPNVLILKDRDATSDWPVFHSSLPTNKYLDLNTTDAAAVDTNVWNNTAPTSSVFTVGDNSYSNPANRAMIAYCFAEKQGYSKFGSYTGNASTDGSFIYTGFKPAFVMCKRTDGADDWFLLDNKRDIDNPANHWLMADSSSAEQTSPIFFDFLSNGFKNRGTGGGNNASGGSYIYMCFAENPFVASNFVPTTAR